MVALLIFALAMGIVFTFRKHIQKITFRRNAYHTIHEAVPEQELPQTARGQDDNGQITERDLNEML
tara:strand:- start:277 stop:474 length:198 start_codon:yes stop_codon:yes gene_type:complete